MNANEQMTALRAEAARLGWDVQQIESDTSTGAELVARCLEWTPAGPIARHIYSTGDGVQVDE